MTPPDYLVQQLADIFTNQDTKQSIVLHESELSKAILFSFPPGSGLAEHAAPMDATIQIISGVAILTVGTEAVDGKAGTWVRMSPKMLHSVKAVTPVVMLLTLTR